MADKMPQQQHCARLDDFSVTAAMAVVVQKSELTQSVIKSDMAPHAEERRCAPFSQRQVY